MLKFFPGGSLNHDRNNFAWNIFSRITRLHFVGRVDFIRADFWTDDIFILRRRTRTFAAKNFRHVERGRSTGQAGFNNATANRNHHGILEGGWRHTGDNFLHGGFFLTGNNFADDVLALRIGIGFDGHGIWYGGDNGHYLRVDC